MDAAEVPVLVDRHDRRRAAEDAAAGVTQRIFFRARSRERDEPADVSVCHGELGQRDRQGRPADSESEKEPARDGGSSRRTRGGGTNYRSPSFDPATGLFIVSAQDSYGIYFFKRSMARTAGRAPITACTAAVCCEQSIIGPARSAGRTISARADRPPAY